MENIGCTITVEAPESSEQAQDVIDKRYNFLFLDNEILADNTETEVLSRQEEAITKGNEKDLIEEAKRNADAFGQLYQHYVKRIYNYHYRHTGNPIEAEDLTSRTFYRALRSIRKYKDKGNSFQAWLFRIAHNLVVNWYRDQSRRHVVSLEAASGNIFALRGSQHRDEPHENVLKVEQRALVSRLIDELPEIRKTLIILKFVEKMSNEEIARVLGKTEGAIKSLYHRTLLSLRESIQQGEFADGLL
jgi:RNA polymerase sigma-70 factor (ECF subfamily)